MRLPGASQCPELLASEIMNNPSLMGMGPDDECDFRVVAVGEGVDLVVWRGRWQNPLDIRMRNDDHRVYFSYMLEGRAEFEIEGMSRWGEHAIGNGDGTLHFTPDMSGRFLQTGSFTSATIVVEPKALLRFNQDETSEKLFDRVSTGQCFLSRHNKTNSRELQAAAFALHQHGFCCADNATSRRHSDLWLQGQGLIFVALFLEGCVGVPDERKLSCVDQRRLERARDLLLADLAKAPSLTELAQQSELGVLKLKRGFRQLFGNSVYGLFQQERMNEARSELEGKGKTVTEVALDLGYSNISHFAAAFRKQFGINPGQMKRL